MRKTGKYLFSILALLAIPSCAAVSQTKVQTDFELEGSVADPVPIPTDIIAMLKSEKSVDACFKTEGAGVNEEAWFEAAEFDLDNDRDTDLIIKPKHSCLFGADQGPFWIFRNDPDGYQKILAESGLKLSILDRRVNSFNTIRISKVVGMEGHHTDFTFSDGRYRLAK